MEPTRLPYPVTFSSNRDKLPSRARAEGLAPLGIIIHGMAQYLTYDGDKMFAPDFLTAVGLSAHGYVDVDGTQVHSVPPSRVAYHAGRSQIEEHSGLNNQWLGVEVLVSGHHDWASFEKAIMHEDPYQDEQYRSTAILCHYWMKHHPTIRKEYIVGHKEVSGPNVRQDHKIDPGKAWNWETFWRWYDLTEKAIQAGELDPITKTT